MQIFPLSQKITIPEYNAVSQSETGKVFSVNVKNNFNMSCVDKSQYQSIMQFLNPKQGTFFSVDVKNNFNMSCVDKSQTCVCHRTQNRKFYKLPYILDYFYNKYVHKQNFSVS